MIHTALIIDDDREYAAMVAGCMRNEGFTLVDAPEDADAVDLVHRNGVHICIIGKRAMGRDGYDVVRELRQRSAAGIIMLSDSAEEIDTVLALEMGADDYLVKPVRPRELGARIRTVLRRTVVTPPDEDGARPVPEGFLRQVDDLEICGVLRLVSIGGRDIKLTPSEFDVLIVLSANTNAVLSRDRIISLVKGDGHAINGRAVDGIISRLRRKLFEEHDAPRRIRTIHGRGYMLVEGG
ncbi:MAG: DNA-binding response regulator [Rhodobacteraceae bacterium CG17_big_fil_post_rev_8_21_14_2_50_65_11]|nr:MAG: DNA-binding response regulator [Rhodobacteraceae bacterium CG17_big_fil_post_rev_8_21_14_2_50_65_11]